MIKTGFFGLKHEEGDLSVNGKKYNRLKDVFSI